MIQTYKTTLTEKKQLTSDVFLYKFRLIEPLTISFIPGQYMILFVPQENGEKARRLYSIASSNTLTDEFELLIKLIPNGCASKYLEKLEIGSETTFQGPAGMFILRESQRERIFIVTGTGYAPVRSMLLSLMVEDRSSKIEFEAGRSKLEKNQTSTFQPQNPSSILHPPSSNSFYLFLGFPYYKDVFLLDELKSLQSSIFNLQSYICLSREQNLDMIPEEDKKYFFLGRVTNGFDQLLTTNHQLLTNSDYYLCSGRHIIESLKQYLYEKGALKEQIFFEKF